MQSTDDWWVKCFLHPFAAQRVNEHQGHVFIYDGIKDQGVERAMDQGFDRIGPMMFINIKKTKDDSSSSASGDEENDTADDGCD